MHSLGYIAERIGAKLRGDENKVVKGIATLPNAQASHLSFLANAQYAKHLHDSQAGAVILAPEWADHCATNVLVMENPYLGYAKASQLFAPAASSQPFIHPTAIVKPSVVVGKGVTIGPNAVIDEGVTLGDGVVVGAGCYLGSHSQLGAASVLSANVTIYYGVVLGARVRVHSGAVLGSDGFGFAPDQGRWVKIAQLGSVRIGEDVEIGANTTIDRGALEDTVIGDNVCLDNQIQIAHNVEVGAGTVIAACAGISGSTTIGRHCMIGGGVGIAGHLKICDGVHITGMTLVTHNIREPGVYSSGTAVEPNKSWRKNVARFRQLDKLARRVNELMKNKTNEKLKR